MLEVGVLKAIGDLGGIAALLIVIYFLFLLIREFTGKIDGLGLKLDKFSDKLDGIATRFSDTLGRTQKDFLDKLDEQSLQHQADQKLYQDQVEKVTSNLIALVRENITATASMKTAIDSLKTSNDAMGDAIDELRRAVRDLQGRPEK